MVHTPLDILGIYTKSAASLLLGASLLLPQTPPAKTKDPVIRLHNDRRDRQAQNAQKIAGEVTNGQLFDAELKNLDKLSRLSADRIFSSARRAAFATLDSVYLWDEMGTSVDEWSKTLLAPVPDDDWKKLQKELLDQIAAVNREIAANRPVDPARPPLLDDIEALSGAGEFLDVARGHASKDTGITPADIRVVKQLTDAASQIASIISDYYSTANIPSASSAVRDMKVRLLRAEIDHITTESRIQSRRAAAIVDLRHLTTPLADGLACLRTGKTRAGRGRLIAVDDEDRVVELTPLDRIQDREQVETTLRRYVRKAMLARQSADACLTAQLSGANRTCPKEEQAASDEKQKLLFLVGLLQTWPALAARVATPSRLAESRLAQEERRYAIRRDAIIARSYEAVIGTGAQRLAAYYQGGIRPETLAQLVQALATAGLIPTIALK
ncbi:MAG: hypothetical protein ABJF23_04860 [Bryobacteraceae bacterium]